MKRFSKLMSLLLFAAVTQYSCINDADVVIADDTHSESNGNLALFFEIPNVATSRSAESSGVTTEGSKEEYAVKSLTVYLFDSTTKTLKDQQELKNINRTVTSGQNIQYTADKITVNPGTYNIFAIANGKAITGNISTQEAFLNAVDAVTYSAGKIPSVPENGFVMTNRGAANLNVEVKKPTDSDKVTSVSIGLERVVAKVELTQTQETFPLTDPSGKTYCTIKLNNFRMLNLATQFYTFRHAHEYQWQFVDDELPGVRAQDNVPDILYGIWHGHRRKCICRSCPAFSSFSDSCPTVSSRFCSAKSCSFQLVWR